MITLEQLQEYKAWDIIAQGVIENGPDVDQLYMTNYNIGRKMLWVAVKGGADDWAIYIHWESMGLSYVTKNGDKVSKRNVRQLVPCTDDVFKRYRQ